VLPQSGISTPKPAAGTSYAYPTASSSMGQQSYSSTSTASPFPTAASNFVYTPPAYTTSYSTPNTSGLISLSGAPIVPAGAPPPSARVPGAVVDEDGEGDDELLPAMADDDYSAQLSWQSQSKDNLK
jgi:transcription initiation factor TFIID subunit 11